MYVPLSPFFGTENNLWLSVDIILHICIDYDFLMWSKSTGYLHGPMLSESIFGHFIGTCMVLHWGICCLYLTNFYINLMYRKKEFLLNDWMHALVFQEKDRKGKALQLQSTKTFSLGIRMMWTTLLTIIVRLVCLNMYVAIHFCWCFTNML